jgi:hypothetical protein
LATLAARCNLVCGYDGYHRISGNVQQAELILRFTRQFTQSSNSRVVTGYGVSPDRVPVDDFENVVVSVHGRPGN